MRQGGNEDGHPAGLEVRPSAQSPRFGGPGGLGKVAVGLTLHQQNHIKIPEAVLEAQAAIDKDHASAYQAGAVSLTPSDLDASDVPSPTAADMPG